MSIDDDLVVRLADTVQNALGLKAALMAPKIAEAATQIDPLLRLEWAQSLLLEAPSGALWREFVEALLVHETYFYRHPVQLDLLSEVVLPTLIEERRSLGHRELRIWCAACATGEEVYTLALLCQDAIARLDTSGPASAPNGPWSVHILGTDLSRSALSLAERGLYSNGPGLNSFRAVPSSARHHFSSVVSELPPQTIWSVPESMRRNIRFSWHNLVETPPPECDADLVLCRNVLIYFERKMALRAERVVSQALRPGGVLLLGPADVLRQSDEFDLIGNDHAFAYQKRRAARPEPAS